MKKLVNPFKPTAGAEPPVLIGRRKVLDDFSDGLDEGVGAPGRLMRITGPRGSGKTVLLTELGDIARDRGWTVVDETASPDLIPSIIRALESAKPSAKLSADIDLGIVKAHAGTKSVEGTPTLRQTLNDVLSKLTGNPTGLLITIDEVQDASHATMREIAGAVQHLIRERKNIALAFAGITTGVMDMLNVKALTFLRRSKPEELAAIPLDQVKNALRTTIDKSGMAIDDDALMLATDATEGYAYLIQLVGYHIWRTAKAHAETSTTISKEDAQAGVEEALGEFNETVHETAIADLPLKAIEYLLTMAEEEGTVATASIAASMGEAASSLTSYRRLLIKRQIIEPTARGYVAFSIPYMREFLLSRQESILARYGR